MSIAEARGFLDIPPVAPVVSGVLAVARVIEAGNHDLLGVEYMTDACAEGGEWADICAFDTTIANCVEPIPLSTGATAGTPGAWTPTPPASTVPTLQNITSGQVVITPTPSTPWTAGQYVVTSDGVEGYWDGTKWVQGRVPAPSATGATAGVPGTWTPAGSTPPSSLASLQGGIPNAVVASPATAWTGGQYVQTATAGAAGEATWTGTGWVGGRAPVLFDPFDFTINEVKAHVEELPDNPQRIPEIQRILDLERAGKNRGGLVNWLDEQLGVV